MSSYSECGERYRLSRQYRLDDKTWWVTLAGSAGHEITEAFDRGEVTADEAEAMFPKVFARHEKEWRGEIRASGRVTKGLTQNGGPSKKDKDWCLHYFPTFIRNYTDWRESSDWFVLDVNGAPAIELSTTPELGGGASRGFVDRVFVAPPANPLAGAVLGSDADSTGHELVIVDLKFGNTPSSTVQLGSYRVALLREYGIEVNRGAYYMAAKGELIEHDLSAYTPEYMDSLYEQAWRGITAGVFLPNVSSFCGTCGVKDYCRAVGGEKAGEIPALEVDLGMPEVFTGS